MFYFCFRFQSINSKVKFYFVYIPCCNVTDKTVAIIAKNKNRAILFHEICDFLEYSPNLICSN